ncbi:type I-B CRISPR-associated protein Cas5b [Thermotoga sp. SG1]|uniref:type I-B CRISPR-associated protein Cas5b n=1 Tax=Thermotoga sp. SG1 TaxID=126739 RepID=UPI000C767D1C|nr:type I-B CRISPR-associated protein Cas5b [Thermotoga sp. SG1]PLV57155.1 type I-B CRISPR-associated protein Cas5 [Thermotoga sp. SG1]
MKVLVFDVSAPYALFRRPYTTTSSYTLPFPPRTTILGLIGCVLGYPKPSKLNNAKVAVQIKGPLRFLRTGTNFVETKREKKASKRIRVSLQLLKEPSYRIFFSWDNEDFHRLKLLLENNETIFTPYLGVASFIAKLDYVGEYNAVRVDPPCEVHTVVPNTVKLAPEPAHYLVFERVTREMDEERNLIEATTYIFRRDLSPVKVEGGEVWKVEGQNIVWM